MIFDALAYRRFRWHDVPPEVGDVERILTYTGDSIPLRRGADKFTVLPFIAPLERLEPFTRVEVAPLGGRASDNGKYPWSRLIHVAPAKLILETLLATMREIDDAQIKAAIMAKTRRAYKTTDQNAGDVSELVNGVYVGSMPVIKVSDAFSADSVINIGDGDTHAQSLNDLHVVALSRACQALGIRMDAIIKKERVVVDELDPSEEIVDVIRANEIEQREKLAAWTGWRLEVLI